MNYLYHVMGCRITIGNVRFDHVKSVSIRGSVKKLSDTAKIILPREYRNMFVGKKRESLAGKNILDFIKRGDGVKIELGYDGVLHNEFSGYVERIGADAPLSIECRDEMYKLRQGDITKSFRSVGLAELLNIIAPDYEYGIIDDIALGKLMIDNASPFAVLEMLRKNYGLHSYFRDRVLYVGFPYSIAPADEHGFVMGRNVRDSSNLKFVTKEDVRLKIRAVSINGDGTRFISEYGEDGGTLRTLHFADKTEKQLSELAELNHKSLVFEGLAGNLLTWGRPRTMPGDSANIRNPNNSGQDGKYLIEGVDIDFNENAGFLRTNKLGSKI